jgi:hypothetical protein
MIHFFQRLHLHHQAALPIGLILSKDVSILPMKSGMKE